MKLTLIRHIKTSAPEGMCYGQTDVALPTGYEAIHTQMAEQLKDETFDAIFASPLQRCSLLAKTIAGVRPVMYDERLKELNFGRWEEKMWSDIEKLPESKSFFEDYIHVAPPEGESFRKMMLRISEFFIELTRDYADKRVLIVSHGGPIRVFNALISGVEIKRIFDFKVNYAEILTYNVSSEKTPNNVGLIRKP
jgi:alpha-ribazole phosphatase